MGRGKDICKQLKAVRRRIADENGIPLEIKECTFKGECRGTCPRCEAEVQYLESELEKRIRLGKAATVAGLAVTLAACGSGTPNTVADTGDGPLVGEPMPPVEDTMPIPPPPDPPHDTLSLLGVVEEGFVVDTIGVRAANLEYLKDAEPVKEDCNDNTSSCNPLDYHDVTLRGESGAVVVSGDPIWMRRYSKVIVPQTTNEKYDKNVKRDNYRAQPWPVVTVDEVDGKKVVSDEQQR